MKQGSAGNKGQGKTPSSGKPQQDGEGESISEIKINLAEIRGNQIRRPTFEDKKNSNHETPQKAPQTIIERIPEQGNLKHRVKRYIQIRFALGTIILILFLALSLVLMKERSPDTPSKRVLNQIGVVMGPPIQEIMIHGAKDDCEDGFEKVKLGVWPGTIEGCFCGDYTNDKFFASKCTPEQIDNKCERIKKVGKEDLDVWRNRIICVKRYSRYFLAIDGNCGSGYLNCGGTVCIPENNECPITSFGVTNSPGIEFGDKYIEIKREPLKLPLAHFKLADTASGWIACLGDLDMGYSKDQYKLLDLKSDQCFYQAYPLTGPVDHLTELEVYEQNGFESKLKKLPAYEIVAKLLRYSLNPLFRLRVKATKICYNQTLYDNVTELTHKLKHSDRTQDAYARMTVGFMFTFLILLIFQAAVIISGKLQQIGNLKLQMYSNIPLVLFNICVIITWFVGSKDLRYMKDQEKTIQTLIDNECFEDSDVTKALERYNNEDSEAQYKFWQKGLVLNALSMILLLCFIVEVIYLKCRIKKKSF